MAVWLVPKGPGGLFCVRFPMGGRDDRGRPGVLGWAWDGGPHLAGAEPQEASPLCALP